MHTPDPIRVNSLGKASCGALLWRGGGPLWVSVIVKSTFRLIPGGPAELIDPVEIVRSERLGATGFVEAADEAIPFLPNAAVLLVGSACAIGGQPTPSATVRLGVAADRALLDKTLYVYGDRTGPAAGPAPYLRMPISYDRAYGGPSVPENPVGTGAERGSKVPNIVVPGNDGRPGGFGPIAQTWSARRHLLGSIDPATLHAQMPEVPGGFDCRYFNPAPLDQQVERLRGDEWIVLDGMHPAHTRVQTRLPAARARAERYAAGTANVAVDMRADMLLIDAENMICSVVWRGRFTATGLDDIRVAAGIELPGQPLVFDPHRAPPSQLAATGALDLRAIVAALPFLAKKAGLESTVPGAPAAAAVATPVALGLAGKIDVDKSRPWESLPHQATDKPSSANAGGVMPKVTKAPAALSMTGGLDMHLLLKDSLPFMRQPVVSAVPAPPPVELKPAAPQYAPAPLEPRPVGGTAEAKPNASATIAPPAMIGPIQAPATALPNETARQPLVATANEPDAAQHGDREPAPPDPPGIELSVGQFATIAAEIAEQRHDTPTVLEAHGLDARAWSENERRTSAVIDEHASRGSHAPRAEYDAAYVAQVERFRGPITPEEYARILLALDRGRTNETLDVLRVHRPALMPIVRSWTRKIAKDARLADVVAEALRAPART